MDIGGSVRFCRRINTICGNVGDCAVNDPGMESTALCSLASSNSSVWNAGILVLVAANGATECSCSLPDILEHTSGQSVDHNVARSSFVGGAV